MSQIKVFNKRFSLYNIVDVRKLTQPNGWYKIIYLGHNNQGHGFHLVDPSPWPIIAGFSALFLTFGGVMYMHGYQFGNFLWRLGLSMILFVMYVWWRDIVREATFEGQHTNQVRNGIRLGMILFIVSEVMFFVAFFWAFFHSSLNPSHVIGGVWPPMFLTVLDPWKVPFLNTLLLLTSGSTITVAHHYLTYGKNSSSVNFSIYLGLTIGLAIIFTGLQAYEYMTAPFTISDGIYGSTFYMATGFHGFHVFIGTCFLIVCLGRHLYNHFTRDHHLGFEAAAWYWHFVDVVWIFLFLTIYWWGS